MLSLSEYNKYFIDIFDSISSVLQFTIHTDVDEKGGYNIKSWVRFY